MWNSCHRKHCVPLVTMCFVSVVQMHLTTWVCYVWCDSFSPLTWYLLYPSPVLHPVSRHRPTIQTCLPSLLLLDLCVFSLVLF